MSTKIDLASFFGTVCTVEQKTSKRHRIRLNKLISKKNNVDDNTSLHDVDRNNKVNQHDSQDRIRNGFLSPSQKTLGFGQSKHIRGRSSGDQTCSIKSRFVEHSIQKEQSISDLFVYSIEIAPTNPCNPIFISKTVKNKNIKRRSRDDTTKDIDNKSEKSLKILSSEVPRGKYSSTVYSNRNKLNSNCDDKLSLLSKKNDIFTNFSRDAKTNKCRDSINFPKNNIITPENSKSIDSNNNIIISKTDHQSNIEKSTLLLPASQYISPTSNMNLHQTKIYDASNVSLQAADSNVCGKIQKERVNKPNDITLSPLQNIEVENRSGFNNCHPLKIEMQIDAAVHQSSSYDQQMNQCNTLKYQEDFYLNNTIKRNNNFKRIEGAKHDYDSPKQKVEFIQHAISNDNFLSNENKNNGSRNQIHCYDYKYNEVESWQHEQFCPSFDNEANFVSIHLPTHAPVNSVKKKYPTQEHQLFYIHQSQFDTLNTHRDLSLEKVYKTCTNQRHCKINSQETAKVIYSNKNYIQKSDAMITDVSTCVSDDLSCNEKKKWNREFIQITHNQNVPYIGSVETINCYQSGRVIETECTACQTFLYCCNCATLLLCSICESIGPINQPDRNMNVRNSRNEILALSVGFGLSVDHIMQAL